MKRAQIEYETERVENAGGKQAEERRSVGEVRGRQSD
jgi:hypothetical protein